jgi:parallel beta-helix repeat protein
MGRAGAELEGTMKAIRSIPVAPLLGLLMAAGTAAADELRVPEDFADLQEAVDAAAPGDRILVGPGKVRGFVHVATPGLTIEGEGGVLVPRAREGGLLVEADGVVIRGLEFRGTALDVVGGDAVVEGNRFRAGRAARPLRVTGDRAVVRENSVDRVRGGGSTWNPDAAVTIVGHGALVEANRISRTLRADGVRVTGDGARVLGNEVAWVAAGAGIAVMGDGYLVDGNACTGVGRVAGSPSNLADPGMGGGGRFPIARACPGIYVRNLRGSGTVSGNRVEHGASAAFHLLVAGAVVRDNVAILDGPGGYGGIVVEGTGVRIESNAVSGGGVSGTLGTVFLDPMDGIEGLLPDLGPIAILGNEVSGSRLPGAAILLHGDGCEARENVATDFAADGLRVEGSGNDVTGNRCYFGTAAGGFGICVAIGDGNRLDRNDVWGNAGTGIFLADGTEGNLVEDCMAYGNGGCGLDNLGIATDVVDSRFTWNEVRDVLNGGTLDRFERNTFYTGDATPVPPAERPTSRSYD